MRKISELQKTNKIQIIVIVILLVTFLNVFAVTQSNTAAGINEKEPVSLSNERKENSEEISKIVPDKANIQIIKADNKESMHIIWNEDGSATGYQVTASLTKDFSEKLVEYTIDDSKKNKITIDELDTNSTYYVKVRAYTEFEDEVVYGNYSAIKKIAIE